MAKISKNVVDADLRSRVFEDADLRVGTFESIDPDNEITWVKINDRQYGCIIRDLNGGERYIRLGAIVAEEREDMSARDLMKSEIAKYQATQAKNAEKAKAKEAKIARDQKMREEKKKKEEEGE